jgi:uncharacterized protein YkwD
LKTLPALCVAICTFTAVPALADCVKPADEPQQIAEAFGQINAYRAAVGLKALTQNAKLTTVAANHACDMADMGKNSHFGSNGADLVQRVKAQGYKFSAANENVGKFGKSKPAQWWYGSTGHRDNMLSAKIKEVGLGVALGPDKQFYWVMVGGSQK